MTPVDDLLSHLEERGLPHDWYRRSIDFMLDSLRLIEAKLPSLATESLAVSRRYWKGDTSPEELEAQRVACWKHLDAHGSDLALAKQDTCALRAVICTMYPTPEDDDMVEQLGFFSTLTNRVEPHVAEQEQLLRKHFDLPPA